MQFSSLYKYMYLLRYHTHVHDCACLLCTHIELVCVHSSTSPRLSLQLRMAGQSQRRWLLVNVQDSMEFASQVLNRDVWSHEAVKSIIAEHFLFWQVYMYMYMYIQCTCTCTCTVGVIIKFPFRFCYRSVF